MNSEASFDIKTAEDFLEKLLAEHQDFKAEPLSARHAINACLTAYHLHEWVWGQQIKNDVKLQSALGFLAGRKRDKRAFFRFLSKKCPDLKTAKAIAEGSKHLRREIRTGKHGGGFDAGFNRGFDNSYLWVERAKGDRQDAADLLDALVDFWTGFFEQTCVASLPQNRLPI